MRILLPLLCTLSLLPGGEAARELPYAPAPADNPLKGLVPYAGQARDFPHSMEFNYLPLRDLMAGPGRYTWDPLDRLLESVAKRGCQTVFRVWLDYPGRETGLPGWLQEAGVCLRPPPAVPAGRKASAENRTRLSDYEDPRLRAALRDFIAALGARYDQDARVGFITAGLLGWWGEWHTSPATGMMASQAVQDEILDAYAQAFHHTPVLVRYPRPEHAARPFGYHDDSFAWGTLATAKGRNSWFFMALMEKAGPLAMARWMTHPIGGEVRPEAWPTLWDDAGHPAEYQDFTACVQATHASWLMDSSISRTLTPVQRDKALAGARLLGYEFQVATAAITTGGDAWSCDLTVRNTGVAPFYRDWPIEIGMLAADGAATLVQRTGWSLGGLKPGDAPRTWHGTLAVAALPPGTFRIAIRVPNPMPGGRPLRFANRDQQADGGGWLVVGQGTR